MRKTTKQAISWASAALASGGILFAGMTILPANASSPASFGVRGVDTSHHNHAGGAAIDWNKVRASGYVFMVAKATEGADWSDRWFSRDLQAARQAGLLQGAYHFYGRTPGAAQARNFVDTMKAAGYTGKRAGELPPTLDLELDKAGHCPGNFSTAGVKAFLDVVSTQMGVKPIIYTNKPFVDTCMNGNGSMLAGHVLWQPRYESGTKEPAAVPRAGQGWKIWQYTETGNVPGIPSKNNVDLNVFRGSLAELRQLAHLGAGGGDSTTPAPQQPTAPPVTGAPVLKANSRGTDVVTAQELLNASGGRIDADGEFGPATTAAVRTFQTTKKLPADGIAGPRTWSLLLTDTGGSAGVPAGSAVALAKQLLETPGITFARTHSETRHNASSAYSNIVDMAAGRGALTSPGSHVGSKRVQLDPRMLRGLLTLHDKYGYRMNISEFVGGVHSKTSRHYRGLSFDVNVINGKHVGKGAPHKAVMNLCSQLGATELRGPGDPNHDTHIHCAWK